MCCVLVYIHYTCWDFLMMIFQWNFSFQIKIQWFQCLSLNWLLRLKPKQQMQYFWLIFLHIFSSFFQINENHLICLDLWDINKNWMKQEKYFRMMENKTIKQSIFLYFQKIYLSISCKNGEFVHISVNMYIDYIRKLNITQEIQMF